MKVLMRGAKCSNSSRKRLAIPARATASINAAHLAASEAAPSGISFGMRRERPRSEWLLRREYRITAALTRAPTGTQNGAVMEHIFKTHGSALLDHQ